jgi:hypothetical protein
LNAFEAGSETRAGVGIWIDHYKQIDPIPRSTAQPPMSQTRCDKQMIGLLDDTPLVRLAEAPPRR